MGDIGRRGVHRPLEHTLALRAGRRGSQSSSHVGLDAQAQHAQSGTSPFEGAWLVADADGARSARTRPTRMRLPCRRRAVLAARLVCLCLPCRARRSGPASPPPSRRRRLHRAFRTWLTGRLDAPAHTWRASGSPKPTVAPPAKLPPEMPDDAVLNQMLEQVMVCPLQH